MLQPKKSKHRKEFRGSMSGIATRGNTVSFGDFGLKALETSWITAAQIESTRRTITHHTNRIGKLWLRIFPHKPTTHKAAGSKMGSGKGDVVGYVAVVKPGTILFEMGAVTADIATEALRLAAYKLPVKTRMIIKE